MLNRPRLLLPGLLLPCVLAAALLPATADAGELVHRHQLQQAQARGLEAVHDYGAVVWMQARAGAAVEASTYALELGGRRFDPVTDVQAKASAYGQGPALRLLQFDAPVRPQWLQQLQARGITPVQHIEPFAYVVWSNEAALQAAGRSSSELRFAGDFLPEYKSTTVAEGIKRGETEWQLMLLKVARIGRAELLASGAELLEAASMDKQFELARVRAATPASLERLARIPGVYAIHPLPRDGGLRGELQQQISANNLGNDGLPVVGYQAWLAGLSLSGAGVTMANVDGGIFDNHPDLVGRMLACAGDTCGGSATDAHGTHTAAIMAGDASSGVRDGNGFLRGLGMAPGANLIEQVYSPHFQQAGGMLKLMRQSFDNGAALSGNSWGPAGSPRGYDADTRQVDVGSRDVNPELAGDQPLTYVLSIMNGNGGTSSQGSPDEAKNVITVGSTKAQFSSGAADPALNDLSSNSGHGPALDGRRIPHLVAPGCRVDSAASATGYSLLCGTSMASPQVAGAIALFIEQFRRSHAGRTPSAALARAALIASVQNLAGNRDADGGVLGPRPDSKQGWGRLRTDRLLAGSAPTLYFDQFEPGADTAGLAPTLVFDSTGQRWEQVLVAADPALPMTLVLSWTDAPGHGLGGSTPAWNNNLDLVVDAGGDTYFGNVFDAQGISQAGGSADARNNVEVVVLPGALAAGGVQVGVVAAALAADGLPNRNGDTDQDFALVCSNCEPGNTFDLRAAADRLQACGPGHQTLDLDLLSLGGYVGSVELLATAPAGISTQLTPASVAVPGSSELAISVTAPSDGLHEILVSADDGETLKSRRIELEYSATLPGESSLQWPEPQQTSIALRPVLRWSPASGEPSAYRLELARDAGFTDVLLDRPVESASHRLEQALQPDTEYWWRLTPLNVCGNAPRTAARSFRTAAPSCAEYSAGNLPQPIGPGSGTQTDANFVVAAAGVISSVEIPRLSGTHTYLGDLRASLIAPDGAAAAFWSPICGSADNFDFGFSDSASLAFSAIPCPATSGLVYRPAAPMAGLAGRLAAGSWTLRIVDQANGDGGSLTAAGLRVCAVDGQEDAPGSLFSDGFED